MTATTSGHLAEIDHPVNIAARRLDEGEIAPAALDRVVAELHAGPITPNRVRDAVSQLAGLGHVVWVRAEYVEELEDGDGVWGGLGTTFDGRSVLWVTGEITGREVRDAIASGEEPIVAVPPTAIMATPEPES